MDIQGIFEKFSISNIQSNLFGGEGEDDAESVVSKVIVIILIIVVAGIVLYKLYKNFCSCGTSSEGFGSILDSSAGQMSPAQFQMKFRDGKYEGFDHAVAKAHAAEQYREGMKNAHDFVRHYAASEHVDLSNEQIAAVAKRANDRNLSKEQVMHLVMKYKHENMDNSDDFIRAYAANEHIDLSNKQVAAISKNSSDNNLSEQQTRALVRTYRHENMDSADDFIRAYAVSENIDLSSQQVAKIAKKSNDNDLDKEQTRALVRKYRHENMGPAGEVDMEKLMAAKKRLERIGAEDLTQEQRRKLAHVRKQLRERRNESEEGFEGAQIDTFNIMTADQMENLSSGGFDIDSYETMDNFDKKKNH